MRGSNECPICNGRMPVGYWNKETCQEWLNHNMTGYKIIDIKKIKNELRVFVKCPNENHDPYWTSWQHIKNEKTRCMKCYYEKDSRILWDKHNIDLILNKYGFSILNRDEYVSSHQKFAAKDGLGFIYMVSIHYLVMNRTKFSLWKNNPYAVHNIKLYCKLYRPDYEFIDIEYKGNKEYHRWRYIGDQIDDDIDREFNLKFGSFVNSNCGHPMLSKSKLEVKCHFILDKYKIPYETQKTFEGCRYKILLRFDFYIVLNGREYCIEVDGNQHRIPIPKFGGLESLLETQKKDNIKNEYCKRNNITLIRIEEKEFKNMESILIRELGLSLGNSAM